jgi:hypothetical protein
VILGLGRASGRRAGTASAIVHRPPGARGDPPADREGSGRRPCARKPPRDGRDLTGARGDGRPADCTSEAKRRLVAEKPLFGAKMFPHMGLFPSSWTISALGALLWRLDPRREPVFRHAALTAASPHIRSSLGSDHNPSCSRASGSGWRDHPVKRRLSAKERIRGHRPPGSGEAVAFSFAGMGSSQTVKSWSRRCRVGAGLSHRVMPP